MSKDIVNTLHIYNLHTTVVDTRETYLNPTRPFLGTSRVITPVLPSGTGGTLSHQLTGLSFVNKEEPIRHQYLKYLQLSLIIETIDILVPGTTILVSLGHL